MVLNTAKRILREGGIFILGFVGRRVINANAILPQLYSHANKIGFTQFDLNYEVKNSPFGANFGFNLIIGWNVPANSTADDRGNLLKPKQDDDDDDEEFLNMFNDPNGITDDE